MAEPASTTTAGALTGAALLALFPGLDAGAVLGAFAGGAVFVMSSTDLTPLKKLGFLGASIAAGLLAAQTVAGVLASFVPARVPVPSGVGALVAAALAVKLLLWLIRHADNPAELLRDWKGGGK
jgi:hypothetical protein